MCVRSAQVAAAGAVLGSSRARPTSRVAGLDRSAARSTSEAASPAARACLVHGPGSRGGDRAVPERRDPGLASGRRARRRWPIIGIDRSPVPLCPHHRFDQFARREYSDPPPDCTRREGYLAYDQSTSVYPTDHGSHGQSFCAGRAGPPPDARSAPPRRWRRRGRSGTRGRSPGAGRAGPPPDARSAPPGAGGGAGDRGRGGAVPDAGRAGPPPDARRAGPRPPQGAGGAGDRGRGGAVPGAGRAGPPPDARSAPPGAGGGAGDQGRGGAVPGAGRAGPPPDARSALPGAGGGAGDQGRGGAVLGAGRAGPPPDARSAPPGAGGGAGDRVRGGAGPRPWPGCSLGWRNWAARARRWRRRGRSRTRGRGSGRWPGCSLGWGNWAAGSRALGEALEAAQAIGDEGAQVPALAGLAPHLTPALLPQALEAARAIGSEGARSQALAGLAPRLRELPPEILYRLWEETLRFLITHTRSDLLFDLEALAPVLMALGGGAAVAETIAAIQDVGRWWP